LTLWLSMTAALGLASGPTRSRSSITGGWLRFSRPPSSPLGSDDTIVSRGGGGRLWLASTDVVAIQHDLGRVEAV
jgi:hypothetical protein